MRVRFGESLEQTLAAEGDARPRIFLMGTRRSGKSSIQKVVFNKVWEISFISARLLWLSKYVGPFARGHALPSIAPSVALRLLSERLFWGSGHKRQRLCVFSRLLDVSA